ncbi:hypothetical protein [Chitinivorax sp. B]|uniref:spermidine synthase n=1 Tax=Chitinivorax sp. B TaxID=2502235 RepID=UPI00148536C7|nr:hypothetical protein [Chitinivorax sp. B]
MSHVLAFIMMVPATFCAGMTLPLITHWLIKTGYGEKTIGYVYAANTIGSIAGVLIAVHLAMPLLGLKWVVLLGGLIDIVVGMWIFTRYKEQVKFYSALGFSLIGLGLVVITSSTLDLDARRMLGGVFRHGRVSIPQQSQVLAIQDGKTATIGLTGNQDGYRIISTNGKPDAGMDVSGKTEAADESTMALLGAIGFAHHPSPQTIAAIGMGSGMTTHTVLSSSIPVRVDTIEIEPAMVRLAKLGFGKRVERTFSDARSNIVIEDAKTYFSLGNKKYDLIISEPSNPWVSGVSSLFSDDFYRHLARHLNEDGVLVQWIQIYETDMNIVASMIKALSRNFGDYVLYGSNNTDMLIVATKKDKISWNYNVVFSQSELSKELERVGVKSAEDLKVRLIGTRKLLHTFFEDISVPANSDFFPYIDLHAARARFVNTNASGLTSLGTADIPYLELLVPEVPELELRQVTSSRFLSRAYQAELVRKMTQMVLSGDSTELSELYKSSYAILRSAGHCSSEQAMRIKAVYEIGSLVAPMIRGDVATVFWSKLESLPCMNERTALRELLSLFRYISARDFQGMKSSSLTLLNGGAWKVDDSALMQFPLRALLVAELASGNPKNANQYWRQFGREPFNLEPPNIEFAMLLNLSGFNQKMSMH